MGTVQHFIEFALFELAEAFVRILPFSWAGRLGGWLGEFTFSFLRFRRDVILENLEQAFPEATAARLETTARGSFRSIGTSLLELLWFPSLTSDFLKRIVSFPDIELFSAILARRKGMVLITAHFGNWELIPQALRVYTGEPFLILYKVQSNRLIDAKIAARRTMFGNQIVPMGLAVREILRFLKEGRCVAMAADQSAPRESIRMKFFGREVPVFPGAAAFALRTGAPLLTMFAVRQPDGSYVLHFKEIPSEGLANDDEGIRELTRRHLAETEAVIRQYPDQWMWMHRRWKHATEQEGSEEAP